MLDIKEKRHITVVGRGGASNVDWDDIQNKPEFATVATSGDYDDLTDKPNLATVATSGSYNDLSDKPSMSTDIPEDKNNAIIIYNESGNTTFTQGVWGGGPIPTEIWQNGVKVTGSITSPYPLVNGKSVIMETLNGEPNTAMEDFEFADKNATIWVYADYKRYNHPISGTYTGDINVVLNNNEAAYNLTQNSSGVKYWLLDNKGNQIRVANNNTMILSDKSLQLHFEGTVTSASDFNLTIYVPKTQYDNLVALLQATFPDIPDITWITDHINQYDYIVSDGYKLRMVTEPAAQVNSDWNASSGVQQILNKPTLATVATSGSYSDLSNTPSLATVATSGSYNDLSNTPSLATVATSGSYNDLSNKPSMSTETLTFTLQGGTTQTITVYTQPTI